MGGLINRAVRPSAQPKTASVASPALGPFPSWRDLHIFDPHRPVVLEAHRMPAPVGGGGLIAADGLALHCDRGLATGGGGVSHRHQTNESGGRGRGWHRPHGAVALAVQR
jgi:hypothetical protein